MDRIFDITSAQDFDSCALELFRRQAECCPPYREFVSLLGVHPRDVSRVEDIPFLPIEFFKSCKVYCGNSDPQALFTSSGTTGSVQSHHYVASTDIYERSFIKAFEMFYGSATDISLFALLPNYLERSGSSLVYMADRLIKMGEGGFFMNDYDNLIAEMACAAEKGRKILLLGVSFALWDLAEKHSFSFPNLTIMETGGMKGRREEITREQLHAILCRAFGVDSIHSEYGMTELLSQGYSSGDGIFCSPPWMKIITRDIHDPFSRVASGVAGGVNVVDLANVNSCSFIETQDMGISYADGSFCVLGRIDRSDIRGCNLMY